MEHSKTHSRVVAQYRPPWIEECRDSFSALWHIYTKLRARIGTILRSVQCRYVHGQALIFPLGTPDKYR